MSSESPHTSPESEFVPDEPTIPELEVDENIPPRPEEEAADLGRAQPDTADHTTQIE